MPSLRCPYWLHPFWERNNRKGKAMQNYSHPTKVQEVIDFGDGSFSIRGSQEVAHGAPDPETRSLIRAAFGVAAIGIVMVVAADSAQAQCGPYEYQCLYYGYQAYRYAAPVLQGM